MKKLLSLLFTTGVMLGLLGGCGASKEEEKKSASTPTPAVETPEKKEELVFANFRDLRDPNPHLYQGEMWAQEMIFETLVSVEPDGIKPCLAESWEVSPDGKKYTFNIRKGMKFSDGEVLDANAIKANFDALWDNKARHVWLESMNLITSYSAPDENTFVIELSAPYYPLLTDLGVTRPFAMASPKVMKDGKTKNGVTQYIGSGPYVLKDFKKNEYAIFEVNENYWGEKPEIKRVVMKVIPENQTRVMALEKGEIDLIYGAELLDTETLANYKDSKKFISSTSDPLSTRQIILNAGTPILKDKNIRYALSHAVNKEAISKGIFSGIEAPAHVLYSGKLPYCDVPLKPFEYNTELANKLLDDSGWKKGKDGVRVKDGQRLSLRVLYDNNSVTGKTVSEYIQGEYSNLGIEVKLEGLERQTYFDALKAGDFDIAHNIAWGSPYDPESSLSAMRGPVYGDYAAQLSLPNKAQIDQAITDVFISTDLEKRQELFNYILTELHNSAVYIPLTFENNKALYRKDLKGVNYKPSQYTIPFWDMSF